MQFKKALFIRFGGIGDILLTTPTLRAVYHKFPGIEIDYVVGGGMEEAISGHPYVNNVIVFDKRGTDSRMDRFSRFLLRISLSGYDLVINLHPSIKSHLIRYVSGSRKNITFRKNLDVSADTGRVLHAIDDFAKEIATIGINELTDHQMDFHIPDSAHDSVSAILNEFGIDHNTKILLVNPAASRPINRWPVSRFQNVCRHFVDNKNTAVVLTGAPRSFKTVFDGLDEIELADCIASVDPNIVNLAGRLTIKELGALINRSSAFLTCDTGPMHIAEALSAPLVLLSGAADPARTGPYLLTYPSSDRISNSTVIIDHSLSCVPCRDRVCSRGDVLCMQNISVNAVIDAVTRCMYDLERKSSRVSLSTVER